MRTYNSYHTCIKQLARTNKLPQKFAAGIDRSTIWRWQQEKESDTLIKSYLKIALALSSMYKRTSMLQRCLSENKKLFVNTLLRYGKTVKVSFILRILNLSSSTFHHWKNQVQYPCKTSALQLCRRIYPNQLTEMETTQLKFLSTDLAFKYWPISSIAHYARRNNILHISLATWYNYIHKLGIKRPAIPRKPRYKIGIRADRPHKIWHADITIVKCLNGMKYYVYLLMDNYSRFILNYQVSTRVSARIRLDSIRNAHSEYIKDPEEDTILLVDGGSENNNQIMDHYINSDSISLQKLIAGKDIHFSNSMVEAQNKLIKYYYLFKHPFRNLDELITLLDWIIKDYNCRRPHHSLGGLTPFEVLTGTNPSLEEWNMQLMKARQTRISENRAKSCGVC